MACSRNCALFSQKKFNQLYNKGGMKLVMEKEIKKQKKFYGFNLINFLFHNEDKRYQKLLKSAENYSE